MMRIFWAAFITTFLLGGINWIIIDSNKDVHQKVYYNTGQITGLGQCSESKCSFTYKDATGATKIGSSSYPVSIGQLVYQECWYEERNGDQCYISYSPSKD